MAREINKANINLSYTKLFYMTYRFYDSDVFK